MKDVPGEIVKIPIAETKPADMNFLCAVLLLHDGFAVHAGQESTHRLACLHANLIARCLARFEGSDRNVLSSDVQRIIAKQVEFMDAADDDSVTIGLTGPAGDILPVDDPRPPADAGRRITGLASDDNFWTWDHETGEPGVGLFGTAIQVWAIAQGRPVTVHETALSFNVRPEFVRQAVADHAFMFLNEANFIEHEGE